MTYSFHLKLRILLYSSVADLQCRLLHYRLLKHPICRLHPGRPYTYRYSTSCHCNTRHHVFMSAPQVCRTQWLQYTNASPIGENVCIEDMSPSNYKYIREIKCLITCLGSVGKSLHTILYMYSILLALPQSTIYMSSAACSSLRCVNKKRKTPYCLFELILVDNFLLPSLENCPIQTGWFFYIPETAFPLWCQYKKYRRYMYIVQYEYIGVCLCTPRLLCLTIFMPNYNADTPSIVPEAIKEMTGTFSGLKTANCSLFSIWLITFSLMTTTFRLNPSAMLWLFVTCILISL